MEVIAPYRGGVGGGIYALQLLKTACDGFKARVSLRLTCWIATL